MSGVETENWGRIQEQRNCMHKFIFVLWIHLTVWTRKKRKFFFSASESHEYYGDN